MTDVDDRERMDAGPIHIGDDVLFDPNVVVTTSGHPVPPETRDLPAGVVALGTP